MHQAAEIVERPYSQLLIALRAELGEMGAQALVTAGKSLRRLAGAVFTGKGAIQHSDTRNARSYPVLTLT